MGNTTNLNWCKISAINRRDKLSWIMKQPIFALEFSKASPLFVFPPGSPVFHLANLQLESIDLDRQIYQTRPHGSYGVYDLIHPNWYTYKS